MGELKNAVALLLVRFVLGLLSFWVITYVVQQGVAGSGGGIGSTFEDMMSSAMSSSSPNQPSSEGFMQVVKRMNASGSLYARTSLGVTEGEIKRMLSVGERALLGGGTLVLPDATYDFDKLGGMAECKKEMRLHLAVPLKRPDVFFKNKMLDPPRGVLLEGPPGTGKTTLAKCVARAACAPMIALRPSDVENMYYGESGKVLRSAFSLARKLQPSIVFLDEIDAMLRPRSDREQEATYSVKCELLQLLDEIVSWEAVIVIATTNVARNLDQAVYRRLSRVYTVGLPDERSRQQIMRALLCDESDPEKSRPPPSVMRATDGFSGADLKDMYNFARMRRSEDVAKRVLSSSSETEEDVSFGEVRCLKPSDWKYALGRLQESLRLRRR